MSLWDRKFHIMRQYWRIYWLLYRECAVMMDSVKGGGSRRRLLDEQCVDEVRLSDI